jgi:hypothetical protein
MQAFQDMFPGFALIIAPGYPLLGAVLATFQEF